MSLMPACSWKAEPEASSPQGAAVLWSLAPGQPGNGFKLIYIIGLHSAVLISLHGLQHGTQASCTGAVPFRPGHGGLATPPRMEARVRPGCLSTGPCRVGVKGEGPPPSMETPARSSLA